MTYVPLTDWRAERMRVGLQLIHRSGEKCGRPTRSKPERRCAGSPKYAGSCLNHLTAEEIRAYRAASARAHRRAIREKRWRDENENPACWSWPINAKDLSTYQEPILRAAGRSAVLHAAIDLLDAWQQGRCAICGQVKSLVLDHDHETGWIRGLLCRRCNTHEGVGFASVLAKYRKRHPAAMFGLGVLYCGPLVGWAPTHVASWEHELKPGMRILDRACYDAAGTKLLPPRGTLGRS